MNRCFLALVLAASVHAQTTAGRLVGTVTDESGASVPQAAVRATNLGTGVARAATTDMAGNYTVPNLAVGSYEVSIEMRGFKRFVQRPIAIEVDQTARIDARLQPGAVTESITITGGAPLVDTDKSDIGAVVENRTIVQLPLNGRNFIRLGSLLPGTTRGAPGNTVVRDRQEGEALTANGQRAEFNNYMVDGADNNSTITGVAVVVPSVDAIEEFKVQTANYSAEFGRAAGAVVNVAIKAGTNQLHGSVYEFLRNEKLDARAFFSPGRTPLRFNLFGASAGGPLVRNKVFLFGNYEGTRERRTGTSGAQVPTEAMRRGDFSGQPTLFDPLALDAAGNRLPFASNAIPAARINPIAARLAAVYPVPNLASDPARNFLRDISSPRTRNQFHIRGDHHLSSADQLMARVSWTKREDVNNAINYNGDLTRNNHRSGVLGWTHLFSPTFLNEARFSATGYGFDLVPEGIGTNFAGELGLPQFGGPDYQRYPAVGVTNLASLGGNSAIPLYRHEYNYQWIDQATWTRGRHTVKAGVDIRRYGSNNVQPQNSSGGYTFTGAFTAQRGATYRTGFGDLLLGLPATQRILIPAFFDANRLRNTRVNAYVQDDINLTPSLTVNVGLRWERDGAWTEKNSRWAYFDFSRGQIVYPKSLSIPFSLPYSHRFDEVSDIKAPNNRAFAPRIGFAWRPFGNNRTVLRSAYGIFFNQPLGFVMLNTALTPPPFLLTQTATSGTTTPELRFGVFPGVSPTTFVPRNPTLFTMDPRGFTNAYIQQWNFGVHREVMPSLAAKLSYVGNKGTKLERRFEANSAAPPAPGAIAARRRYPEFQGITLQQSSSFATYHALQGQLEKQYRHGLSFMAGYTWSKSIDDTSSWSGIGPGDNLPQNPNNIRAEKGRSSFDLAHRFTLAYAYDLPVKTSRRALDLVLGGWQSAGILTLQTGFPTTVTVGGDIPNAAAGVTRANVAGSPILDASTRTIDRWFRTEAFSSPAPFTFGNTGRNILEGPGAVGLDLSLMKVFRVTESHRVQFRAEAFNFANHPIFGLPNTTFANAAFGTIWGGGGGREVQFGLKYIF
jgi:hypothetical protein